MPSVVQGSINYNMRHLSLFQRNKFNELVLESRQNWHLYGKLSYLYNIIAIKSPSNLFNLMPRINRTLYQSLRNGIDLTKLFEAQAVLLDWRNVY